MPEWLKDAVFYEIYPQSFYDSDGDGIGDLVGIIQKLDYIKDLGCNAIWLNPCFASPFKDAGYDVADYKRVALRYGTNEDLFHLFEAAHQIGIHVLLDLVPGHTSEEHPWFLESAKPEKNAYSNRYIWTNNWLESPGNFRCLSGRYDRDGSYVVNFFATQPALNYGFLHPVESWQLPCNHPDCVATVEALKDVIRFWLDRGCDGFRVDMADSLVKLDDEKKTGTGHIWLNVRAMLDADYPEAALISEWSRPELSLQYGFHADFCLDHEGSGYQELFRKRDSKTGQPQSFFSKKGSGDITVFTKQYVSWYEQTKEKGYISLITCNHDTPRVTRDYGIDEIKLAYAFVFTMPGVPFLYYGDEIGMRYQSGLISKEGGYTRTGSRTPMQWRAVEN
ncbi:MAG: alpha-amylase family glycosyl hydrolase, partial [Ethanoligenens sp.]